MNTPLTFADAQSEAMANKRRNGFTMDVQENFCLCYAELAEAYDVWRKGRAPRPGRIHRALIRLRLRHPVPVMADTGPVRDEVADAIIFMLGIADLVGFDAGDAVAAKLAVNAARTYRRQRNGVLVKTGG